MEKKNKNTINPNKIDMPDGIDYDYLLKFFGTKPLT